MDSQKHYSASYLQETAKAMRSLKERSYQTFLQVENGTIIDLGCGTGMDAIMMAKLSGNERRFIGIDHDVQMIEKANDAIGDLKNISFLLQDVVPLPYENESISGVRAERLFQHLITPEKVYDEIYRVLKRDAPFVVVETDWSSISFYNGEAETGEIIRNYLSQAKVNNGAAAKYLTTSLQNHHFKDIKVELFPLVSYSFEDACLYLWIDKIIAEMKEKNLLSIDQHDKFLSALQTADKAGYFTCSINIIISQGVK